MKKFLDEFSLATLSFLGGVVLIIIGYIKGDLDIEVALAYLGGGGAAVGYVRNQAGKGVKRRNGQRV
jgi:hypothetical protein